MTITDTPRMYGAERPTNGHATPLAEQFIAESARTPSEPPAKIENVARARRAGLRQWWRDNRTARTARRSAAAQARRVAEGGADEQDWTRWYPTLIGLVVGVVAVTFALSYHGLFEYADNIAHLPTGLSIFVPVGVDVFSLCSLVATFLCRDAHWRVRAYCWTIFGSTVLVSVAGNAMYAVAEVDKRRQEAQVAADTAWTFMDFGAVAGAALWPAFSAAALHLLIIARRHLVTQRAAARSSVQKAEREAAVEQVQRARAIELAAGGAGCADIATQLDIPRRTIERWTSEIRAAISAKAATPAKPAPRRAT